MSDCCGNEQAKSTESSCDCGCGCGSEAKRTVYFYACSGGANVAEAADQAARALMYDGEGTMFCLAGLGADIQGMVQTAKDADLNIVIDGCPVDCAKKTFDRHGVTNYRQIRVTDLGVEKVKGVACTAEQIAAAKAAAEKLLD